MDYCWDARELGARKLCGNGKSLVRSIIYQENSMCFFWGRAKFLECLCYGSG